MAVITYGCLDLCGGACVNTDALFWCTGAFPGGAEMWSLQPMRAFRARRSVGGYGSCGGQCNTKNTLLID